MQKQLFALNADLHTEPVRRVPSRGSTPTKRFSADVGFMTSVEVSEQGFNEVLADSHPGLRLLLRLKQMRLQEGPNFVIIVLLCLFR